VNGTTTRLLLVGLALLLRFVAVVPVASADRPLEPGLIGIEALDAAGNPDDRAGAHPYRLVTKVGVPERNGMLESTRDIEIEFPEGMGGDPGSVPLCTRKTFDDISNAGCPQDSRVGSLVFVRSTGSEAVPVYNVEPAPGETSTIGVVLQFFRLKFSSHLRPSDYGVTTKIEGLPEFTLGQVPLSATYFEYWGVPAEHQEGTSLLPRPFLTTPTRCDEPLTVKVRLRTWEHPEEWRDGTGSTGRTQTGCQELPFDPSAKLELETPVADTPTGLSMDLVFPEDPDGDARASSQVQGAKIELPEGMAVSLGAASHISACTDAELAVGSEEPATCPASAQVGTVEIGEAQLQEPLIGNVYIGEEKPNERFRLFVVARSGGTETKFIGTMNPDPVTGRLTAVLSDMPQIPLSHLLMHFDGGPKALLVSPMTCGPTTVNATVTPYSGTAPVKTSSTVQVGPHSGQKCGSPAPFDPTLTSSISAQRGGSPTTFSTVVGRRDGEQSTERFSIQFPPGLGARLGSVALCSEAQINAVACPAASKVGHSFIDIGSGPETAELSGDAYLTGPYHGGPFGFALIFNATVGPFHLGTLSVRAAMEFNPFTGQVSVQTDQLPQTFQGIAIRFQQIGLEINRPGFMSTPTSCTQKDVTTTIRSTEGLIAHPSSSFSLQDCVDLPFRPSFSVALTDRAQLHRRGHPGMRISMSSQPGEANMSGISLLLPEALQFSSESLKQICARRAAFNGNCPSGSRVGTGFGRSRLLNKPLKGAVYVVQPHGDGEPDLWTNLHGQGIELNIRSRSVSRNGRVENSFEGLPDMPLSFFSMKFAGGKHGFLALDRNLCHQGQADALTAPASFKAHNGADLQTQIPIATPEICKAG
jgi:hypothetical protein